MTLFLYIHYFHTLLLFTVPLDDYGAFKWLTFRPECIMQDVLLV